MQVPQALPKGIGAGIKIETRKIRIDEMIGEGIDIKMTERKKGGIPPQALGELLQVQKHLVAPPQARLLLASHKGMSKNLNF